MSSSLFTAEKYPNIGVSLGILYVVTTFILFLFPYEADAGAIISRPLAASLNIIENQKSTPLETYVVCIFID